MDEETGIEAAVRMAGSQSEFARQLGVTPQAVSEMVKRGYAVAEKVLEIEERYGVDRSRLLKPTLRPLVMRGGA